MIEEGSTNVYTDLGYTNGDEMLDCLTRLGREVQIVIGSDRHTAKRGRVSVVSP